MLIKHGYMSDELVDFLGGHLKSYRAHGRWFIALWRWCIGIGPNSTAAGLTAGALLSLSLIVLTKSLQITNLYEKLAFGAIYLIHFQFAYVMEYSYQSDVTAFGLLCVALASCIIQSKTKSSLLSATVLLAIALSIYQALLFNFCIIILVHLYRLTVHGQWTRTGKYILKTAACCVLAYILHAISRKIVVALVYTDPVILRACLAYQADFNVAAKIGLENLTGLAGQAFHTLCEFFRNAILPTKFPGEWFYSSAIIPLILLGTSLFKGAATTPQKWCSFLLLIAIWIFPFVLMLIFLNPDCMDVHNRLGESLSLACLWTLAIPTIRWSQRKMALFAIILGVATLKAANYTNAISNARRAEFEARLAAFKQMEFEAARVAADSGIPITRENIILFFHTGSNYYLHNHMGDYPAIIYMSMARTAEELKMHREILDSMPFWPANGSIKAHNGKVIIKTGYSSYKTITK